MGATVTLPVPTWLLSKAGLRLALRPPNEPRTENESSTPEGGAE